MLRVFQIKVPLDHSPDTILRALARSLQIAPHEIVRWELRRQAIDARRKGEVRFILTVDAELKDESRVLRRITNPALVVNCPDESYHISRPGVEPLKHRPVVVGSGPAGLFAALMLSRAGYRPIVLERGKAVGERCVDVERFWQDGVLNLESNAQFGEGGAGTFSDGKLNTLIGDPRCRTVLEEMANAGAPRDILVNAKPHIGTDVLRAMVPALRGEILRGGGDVRFCARMERIIVSDGAIAGVETVDGERIDCRALVLAIGHSARDTFAMLVKAGVVMNPKPFAIGVRIEHLQGTIDATQYGASAGHARLGAADYKMVWHGPDERSAYTFCMCPGGHVIAASSHENAVVTNGMSLRRRDGRNANAALLVNVEPRDFGGDDILAGFTFQSRWERLAFETGGGDYFAPAQLTADMLARRGSTRFGAVTPSYAPGVRPADIRSCLPAFVVDTIASALPVFGKRLRGFDAADGVLSGVETRSSCPVRITRAEDFQSSINGMYPAGEGAGYAGGIMSTAVDGMRAAEAIIKRFAAP